MEILTNVKRLYISFKSLVNDFVYSFGRAALLLLVEVQNHTVPVRERGRIRVNTTISYIENLFFCSSNLLRATLLSSKSLYLCPLRQSCNFVTLWQPKIHQLVTLPHSQNSIEIFPNAVEGSAHLLGISSDIPTETVYVFNILHPCCVWRTFCIHQPLVIVRPLYRTGISLLSKEGFLYI